MAVELRELRTEQAGIQRFFPPELPSVERSPADTISSWTIGLKRVADCLVGYPGFEDRAVLHEAIDRWATDEDHGAMHSYFVYQGMVWLREQDERYTGAADDSKHQALAILHDLGQFFPIGDFAQRKGLVGDGRKLHAIFMADILRERGDVLGLSPDDIDELAFSIKHHDDSYDGVYNLEELPYSGQLLNDADKLFANTMSRDPRKIIKIEIDRKQKVQKRRDTWYLIRPELTAEQREEWRYGDRWLQDDMSPIRRNFADMEFYTPSAITLGEEIRRVFPDIAAERYGQAYSETMELVGRWKQALEDKRDVKVYLVGKNQEPVLVDNKIEVGAVIGGAYEMRLPLDGIFAPEDQEGFTPKGWRILVVVDEEELQIIDPSIARFRDRESFEETVRMILSPTHDGQIEVADSY